VQLTELVLNEIIRRLVFLSNYIHDRNDFFEETKELIKLRDIEVSGKYLVVLLKLVVEFLHGRAFVPETKRAVTNDMFDI